MKTLEGSQVQEMKNAMQMLPHGTLEIVFFSFDCLVYTKGVSAS